jgi:hypothetical protein
MGNKLAGTGLETLRQRVALAVGPDAEPGGMRFYRASPDQSFALQQQWTGRFDSAWVTVPFVCGEHGVIEPPDLPSV